MAFKVKAGKVKTAWLPVTTSTAIARGALVTFSSGLLVAATAQTANAAIVGVLDKTIATTDSDFATARLVPVIVPIEKHVLFEGDVTSGLVAADLGTECDLTDASTVDRSASTYDVAKAVGVISSTKGLFWLKINGSY
jgi:hypothetical protein